MNENETSSSLRILLVEDDEHDVLAFKRVLKKADTAVEITTCGRAEDALDRLRSDAGAFDLAVIDHKLPGMSGLELCKTLLGEKVPLPLVILTGQGSEALAVEALKAGVENYVVKAPGKDYLDLLPVVLLEAVRKYQNRLARKRAEENLRADQACFRDMIYNNADGNLIVDSQGIVRLINPAAKSLFGVKADKLLDQPFGFPIVGNEATEVELVSAGRDPVIAEMRSAKMMWKGELVQVVSLRDVTERKIAEELDRYRRRELKMKDQFISHVSHELRSPLSAIYQFVTILLDGLAGEIPDEQREHLETILRNSSQLKVMIDDLLDVSRAQTGKLTVRPRYLTLAECIRGALESCSAASAKDITLSADVPDNLPPAYADGQRVRQIVTNLIDNAVKFTPRNGSTVVRAEIYENDPDYLCVSVSDMGCGISDEDRERIFEQMYQVQYNGDAGRKGLGLGLYICKELVSRHGGRLWVESELHHGSTFFFTLPVFSLAKSVGPILTEDNLLGGSMAMIIVDVASTDDRSLGKLEEAALGEVWDILDRCIIRAMDVVLPRMPRRKTGETFYVVACVDEGGTESLVGRMRQQLAGCDALRTAGLAATVFATRMDLPPLTENTTPEEIAKDIKNRIEDLVMTPG
jgi:PAS domain S-box-containing protein